MAQRRTHTTYRSCVVAALLGCGNSKRAEPAPGPPAMESGLAASDKTVHCEAQPFAESSPIAEASGAAWLPLGGLVVVSDSGHRGAYAVLDPDTGATRAQGALPLGDGGDDVEGLAVRNGKLYGVTSAGWISVWRASGSAFELADGPYALGPVDLPDAPGGFGSTPPDGDGMVCPAKRINCGRNYEGLCLLPTGDRGGCVGLAAAKADGHVYCVVERDGRLAVDRARKLAIAEPGQLADCAFALEGDSVYVGNNAFGASRVVRIDRWDDPARARIVAIGDLAAGFAEALAVRGDTFYRFSDTGGAPSRLAKFRCAAR